MKLFKSSVNQVAPKGERMQWEPLKAVKPVKLSSKMTTGKLLSQKELNNRNNNSFPKNILVP